MARVGSLSACITAYCLCEINILNKSPDLDFGPTVMTRLRIDIKRLSYEAEQSSQESHHWTYPCGVFIYLSLYFNSMFYQLISCSA